MRRGIRLVVVALVVALALAACGGKEEAPKAAATDSSAPQVVADGSLAGGEKVAAPKGEVVLTVAGVPESASKVSLTALDDYKADFKVADVRSSQMLLATKADGRHMPVDRSGPIRIVIPTAPASAATRTCGSGASPHEGRLGA